MKRKPRISTLIVLLLLLSGLGLMLYPTASDLVFRWQAAKEIEQYNMVAEGTDADYSEYWEAAEAYNAKIAEAGSLTAAMFDEELTDVSEYLNVLGTGLMGYVEIPAINVSLPIYQGTSESALQAGAGFWIGSSLPTGGESTHCILTAHCGLVKAKMFTDLDQLEIGDTFTVTVLDRVLTYEVDQILVVLPDELDALQVVEGEDYVTLYTCTPYGVNTHRLLVRGRRVETAETGEAQTLTELVSEVTWWQLVLLILAILLLGLLLLWIIAYISAARKHGEFEPPDKHGRRRGPGKFQTSKRTKQRKGRSSLGKKKKK